MSNHDQYSIDFLTWQIILEEWKNVLEAWKNILEEWKNVLESLKSINHMRFDGEVKAPLIEKNLATCQKCPWNVEHIRNWQLIQSNYD